jgi:dienelactone hydrolase
MRFSGIPLVAFAASLAVASCSSTTAPPASGPTARFALSGASTPAFMAVPFPADVYLEGGHVMDPIPGFDAVYTLNGDLLGHQLGKLDGFSRIAPAMFYVDDPSLPPDPSGQPAHATLDSTLLPLDASACVADGSPVYLIDLAASDPAKARIPCRAEFRDDSARGSSTHPVLAVGPARGVVLAEGHAYAAVLTSRLKDTGGRGVQASADLARVRDGGRSGPVETFYGGALDAAKAALAGALATDGATIVSIAPYTTSKLADEMFVMRDYVEGQPAPALAWDPGSVAPMVAARFGQVNGQLPSGFTATLDGWLGKVAPTAKLPDGTDDPDDTLPVRAHDKIAAVGTAAFTATNFLVQKPGGYSDLEHGTVYHDANGSPAPPPDHPTETIWVTIALPAAPMPPAGYPAVIVQHGLSSSRAYLLSLANTFCKMGWAAVAIDSITFGARAPEAMYQVDQHTDYESAPGATYKGPDGLADAVNGSRNGPLDLFGGMQNLGAFRDQMRQAEIDTAQLVKVLRGNPDLSPLKTGATAPKIDPDRIAYVGDSLGGIQGAAAAAIEPRVKAWTLNVAGGGVITEMAANAPSFGSLIGLAAATIFGFLEDEYTAAHPMLVLVQTLIDAGDPLSYASRILQDPAPLAGAPTGPRNVLQTEVLYDELVANEAGEALAFAAGFALAEPNVGTNAGTRDLKNPANNHGKVDLVSAPADASGIHDVPMAGVTAVVVQVSPGQHGSDIVRAEGHHSFAIPYALFDTDAPFHPLDADKQFNVEEGYRELQAAVVGFFGGAFAGKVPAVSGFKPPVRDFDGDGATDDVDRDPSDPTVQ